MHAAAPVIPAALAVAEREHATGEAFLLAVTVGYEAALRIGEAVNPSHYRFWHPTGTAATFGAAAAAGSLLGLDAEQMLDALGTRRHAGRRALGVQRRRRDEQAPASRERRRSTACSPPTSRGSASPARARFSKASAGSSAR